MSKLKPCPFCGAEEPNVENYFADVFPKPNLRGRVYCHICGCVGPVGIGETAYHPISAWNERRGEGK